MTVQYTDTSLVTEVKATQQPTYGQTADGYGGKIPTRYMVRYAGRWRRIYAMAYGNSASLYVVVGGQDLHLDQTTDERLSRIGGY